MLFLLALYKLTTPSQRRALLKSFRFISIIVLLLNFKSLPLIYHLRYVLYVRPVIMKLKSLENSERKRLSGSGTEGKGGTEGGEGTVTKVVRAKGYLSGIGEFHTVEGMRCLLDDLDLNIHMNNSSYNKALDYIRISFFAATFGTSVVRPFIMTHKLKSLLRLSKHEGKSDECRKELHFANAGTMMWFLKSIGLGQKYSIKTKLLTWDRKWVWTLHYFVVEGGEIVSVGLVKQCLKFKSGKTVNVWDALSWAGHCVYVSEVNGERRVVEGMEEYRARGMEEMQKMVDGQVDMKDYVRSQRESEITGNH